VGFQLLLNLAVLHRDRFLAKLVQHELMLVLAMSPDTALAVFMSRKCDAVPRAWLGYCVGPGVCETAYGNDGVSCRLQRVCHLYCHPIYIQRRHQRYKMFVAMLTFLDSVERFLIGAAFEASLP
jgi:hypothetical protein